MEFSTVHLIILALVGVSFISVIILAISHLKTGNTCPKVFAIPACYILIMFMLMILLSHLSIINDRNILFFTGAGLTFLIAVYASFSHIRGSLECPKLFDKIPMCYLSLITFGIVIVLKIIEIK